MRDEVQLVGRSPRIGTWLLGLVLGVFGAWLAVTVFIFMVSWSRGIAVPILLYAAGLYYAVRSWRARGKVVWRKSELVTFRVWVLLLGVFTIGVFVHELIRLPLFILVGIVWFVGWPVKSKEGRLEI
jgi:hypothetical protein